LATDDACGGRTRACARIRIDAIAVVAAAGRNERYEKKLPHGLSVDGARKKVADKFSQTLPTSWLMRAMCVLLAACGPHAATTGDVVSQGDAPHHSREFSGIAPYPPNFRLAM
jgi:hypothetical protein